MLFIFPCSVKFLNVSFLFQISISYSHTIGTRVRLSLLRSVSKRQREKDPNAVCSVSSFTPRPMLRVGGGKDKGTRFLSFVDAMLGFKHLLTQEDLDKAASMCQGLKGHLRSRFIVLSDDRQPPPPPTKKRPFDDLAEDSPRIKRFQNVPKKAPFSGQAAVPQQSTSAIPQNLPPQPIQPGQMVYLPQGHVIQQVQASVHQPPPATQVQQFPQSQMVYVPQGQMFHQHHQQGQVTHTPVPVQDPTIFSPSAFPPLQQSQSSSAPLLTQPSKVMVPGDGYQTVVGKGRRQSQRVPGVQGIVQRKQQSKDQAKASEVLAEENIQVVQDRNDSQSDSSFVDAPDI